MGASRQEFCVRCNRYTDVKSTGTSEVHIGPGGIRYAIRTELFHCEHCKSFVRRHSSISGEMLKVEDDFTPKARNIWRALGAETQRKTLNHVWCTRCRRMTAITGVTGKVDSGMLVLLGKCTRCGGDVARVVANE